MGPDGHQVFNETRPLQNVTLDGSTLYLNFSRLSTVGPISKHYYENLNLYLLFDGLMQGDLGAPRSPFPPVIGIDPFSELFASGHSAFIGYLIPGYGGSFRFGEIENFSARLVPVPEPSTYGLAALLILGTAVVWRRYLCHINVFSHGLAPKSAA